MVATPRAALDLCKRSKLLRPICPRLVPFALDQHPYDLADGCANAPHITIISPRCTLPVWSYEVVAPLPSGNLTAWDGNHWFAPSYAPATPPPYHVHVEIQAAEGGPPAALAGPSFTAPRPTVRITDELLNPARTHPASLGTVRWFGRIGQLVFAPTNPNGGGEEAGHLIFAFHTRRRYYDISLHAWAPRIRIDNHGRIRIVAAAQRGPALPHVIATLKKIVGSVFAR